MAPWVASGAAVQNPAPLPTLVLESLPPSVRADVAAARRRASERPRDPEAVGRVGMILHAYEQFEAAGVWYMRARRLAPQSFRWNYAAALAELAAGKQREAVALLQEAVRLDPATVPARVKLAEALMAEGDIASAATVYEDLARVAPDLPHAQYGLGRVKAAQGRRDEALQHYRKACALFDEYGAAHYALALLYRDVGDKDKSRHHLTLYEQHKMTAPAVPDPFVSEVRALRRDALDHIARGIALSKSNDLAGAIEAHERALAADATLEQARVNLIILYGKTGDTAAAERHYRALMASNPGLADGHYNFGIVLLNAGRYPEAKEAFRAAIAANPALPAAHNNLGQLLEGEALVEEAAAHYRRAVDADPQYRLARFNLGRMLVALKRHDEAVEQFERLLAGPRDAETPRHLFALATAHVHAGRRDEGVRLATEAQALAVKHGQQELAAAIERDLRRLQGQP